MKIRVYAVLALAGLVFVAGTWADDVAKQSQATKKGWWLKVCRGTKTECEKIEFWIGPDKDNITQRLTWVKGVSADEFDVSAQNIGLRQIYVKAQVIPDRKNGYFSVVWKDKYSKHYDFNRDEDHDVKPGDDNEWKCN